MVRRLHRLLRGWATYFCPGTVTAAYHNVTAHARHRLWQWLAGKYKLRGSRRSRFADQHLHETLGLIQLRRQPPWSLVCASLRPGPRAGYGKSPRPVRGTGSGNGARWGS